MEHDYCYSSNIPKSECDKNMLGKLSSSESKTFGAKVAKTLIVKPIIGTKYQLGLGKKKKKKNSWKEKLADELHKKSEMRSFKSNENIHLKKGGSDYVVSANKASSDTL